MDGDVEKMMLVGLIWGTTNSLMRRGAQIWEETLKQTNANHPSSLKSQIAKWVKLISIYQYSVPFMVNLSASAMFFYLLSDSRISVAVPVTNATTFAATAVSAFLLGEKMRLAHVFLGVALIVFGAWICVM